MRQSSAIGLAAGVGALVGLGLRRAPVALAVWVTKRLYGRSSSDGCPMERVLECVVEDAPAIIGAFLRFVLVLAAVTGVMAIAALVVLLIAITRTRRRDRLAAGQGVAARIDAVAVSLVGAGAALAVPPLWMLGWMIASWLG